MKSNELSTNKKSALANVPHNLPPVLVAQIESYPENTRRPVNKIVFKNPYFQLTYHTRNQSLSIGSRGNLVYSAIPYDTARNYIQRAAIQYLVNPEKARQYIELHRSDLEKYLVLSIFQTTHQQVSETSTEVQQAYQVIFDNPLFEIQILGRLLQHDETGPLSANLAGKFLFSENMKTGIMGYVGEFLKFVVELTQMLPVKVDGHTVQLLTASENTKVPALTFDSKIESSLATLPEPVKASLEETRIKSNTIDHSQPLLRSEYGAELAYLRKNYHAHSVQPNELSDYFKNVHSTENRHLINVVSDIHASKAQLPFVNHHFNILAGDISDAQVIDQEIKGIYLIGGHELRDVLPKDPLSAASWDKWRPFFNYNWFKELRAGSDEFWYSLPLGDHPFYTEVQEELQKRFSKMTVLHNSSLLYEGVRYIGLTLPVVLVNRKESQQRFILNTLEDLLAGDHKTPTVIVSHAPLFNELSLLSPQSTSYNKSYTCDEPKIEKLFETYNVIGAIHGHHHIPASSRRFKKVQFGGKQLFVVCSIYSKINTGFELMSLLD